MERPLIHTHTLLVSSSILAESSYKEFNKNVNLYQQNEAIDVCDLEQVIEMQKTLDVFVERLRKYNDLKDEYHLQEYVSTHSHIHTLGRKNRGG